MNARALQVILFLLVCCQVMAGQGIIKVPGGLTSRQRPPKPPQEDKTREVDQIAARREAIDRVSRYVLRAGAFKGLESRTMTVVRIADVSWDLDQAHARKMFLDTFDSLKGLLPSEDDKSAESREIRRRILRLSSSLISLLSRHDALLAGKLKPIGSETEGSAFVKMGALNSANRLLGAENDQTKAIATAESALGAELGQEVSSLMLFLQELRARDAEAANKLFLLALERVKNQKSVDPETLTLLGTYLFGDPRLIGSEQARTTVRRVKIDNLLVISLAGDRPGVPEGLVAAYLATAVEAIYTAEIEPDKRPYYYVLGYQLWAKVERVSPNLMPMLNRAIANLSQDVSPALTQIMDGRSAATASNESELDIAGTIKHVEEIVGVRLRDTAYFKIASGLFQKGNLTGARQLVSRIDDLEVRASVTSLIDSAEALDDIKKGKLLDAESITSKMKPRVETALVWLEIAHARIQRDYKQFGREAINESVKVSAALEKESRPMILLLASSELAPVDSLGAFNILGEAVRLLDSDSITRASWAQLWRQTVEVGEVSRNFEVKRIGLPGDWATCIRELAMLDFAQVESLALTTNCEEVASDFLVALVTYARNGARQAHPKIQGKPESQPDRNAHDEKGRESTSSSEKR